MPEMLAHVNLKEAYDLNLSSQIQINVTQTNSKASENATSF